VLERYSYVQIYFVFKRSFIWKDMSFDLWPRIMDTMS